MTDLNNLRLAAALAHTAPGAELQLFCGGGAQVTVSQHPAADMTPCQFRTILISLLSNGAPPSIVHPAARITLVEIGGALVDLGGGVQRSRTLCGIEQRWITTSLPWSDVCDVLDRAGPEGLPDDAMNANVRPDEALGVTTLAISANDRRYQATLDCVAADVAARCMADELIAACNDAVPAAADFTKIPLNEND